MKRKSQEEWERAFHDVVRDFIAAIHKKHGLRIENIQVEWREDEWDRRLTEHRKFTMGFVRVITES